MPSFERRSGKTHSLEGGPDRSLSRSQPVWAGQLDAARCRVVDSTADIRYLVVPLRPAGTDDLDEDALASLVTRDSMIGVSQLAPRLTGV